MSSISHGHLLIHVVVQLTFRQICMYRQKTISPQSLEAIDSGLVRMVPYDGTRSGALRLPFSTSWHYKIALFAGSDFKSVSKVTTHQPASTTVVPARNLKPPQRPSASPAQIFASKSTAPSSSQISAAAVRKRTPVAEKPASSNDKKASIQNVSASISDGMLPYQPVPWLQMPRELVDRFVLTRLPFDYHPMYRSCVVSQFVNQAHMRDMNQNFGPNWGHDSVVIFVEMRCLFESRDGIISISVIQA